MTERNNPGEDFKAIKQTERYKGLELDRKIGVTCYFFDPNCFGLSRSDILDRMGNGVSDEEFDDAIKGMYRKRTVSRNYRSVDGGDLETLYSFNHRLRGTYGSIVSRARRECSQTFIPSA